MPGPVIEQIQGDVPEYQNLVAMETDVDEEETSISRRRKKEEDHCDNQIYQNLVAGRNECKVKTHKYSRMEDGMSI